MNFPALGTSPVSAESPAGEDIRYQPAFEDLQAEVDKLSSPWLRLNPLIGRRFPGWPSKSSQISQKTSW
jgi:hypothetical protein